MSSWDAGAAAALSRLPKLPASTDGDSECRLLAKKPTYDTSQFYRSRRLSTSEAACGINFQMSVNDF